jgi:hypothetical protein
MFLIAPVLCSPEVTIALIGLFLPSKPGLSVLFVYDALVFCFLISRGVHVLIYLMVVFCAVMGRISPAFPLWESIVAMKRGASISVC